MRVLDGDTGRVPAGKTKEYTFRRGDLVIQARPFVAALQPQLAGEYCDECMQPLSPAASQGVTRTKWNKTIRCQNCPFANYCSRQCQKAHSEYHEAVECAMLREFIPEIPDVTFRLFAKLLYKTHGRDFSEFSDELFTGEKRTFQDLLDHRENIQQSPIVYTRFRTYLAFVLHTFPDNLRPDQDRALQIFGRMMINRFSVQSAFLDPIGEALYIGPSVHDHSCCPDAAFTFDGAQLSIRVTRDMTVSDPRQVYICYMDILQPLSDRLSFLEDHYFFRCACLYCSDLQQPINKISAVKESLRDSLRGSLQACFRDRSEPDLVQLENVFDRARSLIEADDSDEAVACEGPTLKYWKIDALAVAFEAAERLTHKRYHEALTFGMRLFTLFRLTYGENRPCVSVLSLRLAAIFAELVMFDVKEQRTILAVTEAEAAAEDKETTTTTTATTTTTPLVDKCSQMVNEALTRLTVTHGKTHPLTQKAAALACRVTAAAQRVG